MGAATTKLVVTHASLFVRKVKLSPTRIVVALVDNRAFNGDRAHNPFNFHHYNLSEISLYLDEQQQYALKPLQPNFGDGLYVRTYSTLFAGTCKLNRDQGLIMVPPGPEA